MPRLDEVTVKDIDSLHQIRLKLIENWMSKDVIFLYGKFKGRRGKIRGIDFHGSNIMFLVHPYRLRNKVAKLGEDVELLWDDPQARSWLAGHCFELAD